MKKLLLLSSLAAMAMIGAAKADPVEPFGLCRRQRLYRRAGADLRQLANTYQEDANALMSWYSGWYNGLAHKHYMDYKKGREARASGDRILQGRTRTRRSFTP